MSKNMFTKSELDKLIRWTSSRFNPYKKSDVIESILRHQEADEDVTMEYSCGSWTEPTQRSRYSRIKNMNMQGTYIFKKEGNVVSLKLPNGNEVRKTLLIG